MARDPGLQAERTALAWSRTALGALANALIMLRAGLVGGRVELAVIGVLLLVAAGVMQRVSAQRRRQLAVGGAVAGAPAVVLLGLALLVALCSAGAVLALGWHLLA